MAFAEALTGAKSGQLPASLRVLLVGAKEEDFFLIREILGRVGHTFVSDLDHAHSLEEATPMLKQKNYGLVLFEHEPGDGPTVELLGQVLHGVTPAALFIVLTENADEKTVAEIIAAGAWDCVGRSQLDGVNLVRTIRSTLALQSLRQEQHTAQEWLRKLSLAVEQSADTVIITNREGIIEYVNPAFEALTGY